jgi:hypothetical protein
MGKWEEENVIVIDLVMEDMSHRSEDMREFHDSHKLTIPV